MRRIPKTYYGVFVKENKRLSPVKLFKRKSQADDYTVVLKRINYGTGYKTKLVTKKVADKGSIKQFRRRFGDLK